MKRYLLFLIILFCCLSNIYSQNESSAKNNKIKTGWNFGVLPSVAFDADLGFQYGALTNIYNYGDGSIYPEYFHSIYLEAAYTTKRNGIFRFFYNSKYLIPNHNLSVDISYLPDAMCDFYGFNGYNSIYNDQWHKKNKSTDNEKYISRAFYKYKRDLFRVAADIDGAISGNFKWNAGIGILNYKIGNVNLDVINKGKDETSKLPDVDGLYQKYIDWNLIKENEKNGGSHPYIRLGFTYDSRNITSNPSQGIYADIFGTYNAAFGNQKEYNNLKLNFNFRHYVSLYTDKIIFAYRISTQNTILGKSPFYLNTYHNTLFLKRVIYEALGGSNSLRGIMRNRILSDGFAMANVEFRIKIIEVEIGKQHFYLGINPFVDMGMITQAYNLDKEEISTAIKANNTAKGLNDNIDDYFNFDEKMTFKPHFSGGLGLKIAMNENFVLSVDCARAFNKQDNSNGMNLYIKMGYLF